jgi:hypothetical protein
MTDPDTVKSETPESEGRSAAATRWTGVILLSLAVFAGPFLFGAVERWAWAALWCVVTASALAALLAWLIEGRGTVVFAPVVLFAALVGVTALVQLVPVPAPLLALFGGTTSGLHKLFGGSVAHRISMAPGLTIEAALKASLFFAAGFAAVALIRSRGMLFAVVGSAAAAMILAACLGIVQERRGRENIYWARNIGEGSQDQRSTLLDPSLSTGVVRVKAVEGSGDRVFFATAANVGDVFGPYASSNQFGGLVAVTMPVVLALFIAVMASRRGGWAEEGGFTGTPEGALVFLLSFGILAGMGAAVYSGSFGSLGAISAGCAVMLLVMILSRRARLWTVAAIVIVAATAAWAGVSVKDDVAGSIRERLDRRRALRATALSASKDFAIAGSGLGTYSTVAPHYEKGEDKHLFAHNEYIQFALEAGYPAAIVGGLILAWQLVVLVRGAFRAGEVYCGALCAGAAGSMAAAGFHGLFDYSLHVPANTLILVTLIAAGTAAVRARHVDIETVEFRTKAIVSGRGRLVLLFAATLVAAAVISMPMAAVGWSDLARTHARELLSSELEPKEVLAKTAIVAGETARAAKYLPWDAEIAYLESRMLDLEARSTPGETAEALLAKSTRSTLRAARLAPSYTFYSMSAVTMGAAESDLAELWTVPSFAFHWTLGAHMVDAGRFEEGFGELAKALVLEEAMAGRPGAQSPEAIARLVTGLGDDSMVAGIVPESFGAVVNFAEGLYSAGREADAMKEYARAAKFVDGADESNGLNERSALLLADRLVEFGLHGEAEGLYSAALSHRPNWQYLRLSHAKYLLSRRRMDAADAEVTAVLDSDADDKLKQDARDMAASYRKK